MMKNGIKWKEGIEKGKNWERIWNENPKGMKNYSLMTTSVESSGTSTSMATLLESAGQNTRILIKRCGE